MTRIDRKCKVVQQFSVLNVDVKWFMYKIFTMQEIF